MIQSVNLVIQTIKMRDYEWNDIAYSQALTRVLGNDRDGDDGDDADDADNDDDRKNVSFTTSYINSYRNRAEWNDLRVFFSLAKFIHRTRPYMDTQKLHRRQTKLNDTEHKLRMKLDSVSSC